jgi:hypothetical protein
MGTPVRAIKTQTGSGTSGWVPLDPAQTPFCVGFGAVVSGTVAYSIEHTFDNIFDSSITPTAFTNALGTGLSTNQDGNYIAPVAAVRINVASGSGSVTLTVLQGRGN